MKKQILSTVFSIVLALFLALALLAGSLCVFAKTVVCKPDSLREAATSSKYTQELYEQIQYSWENYLAISGVSEPEPIMAILTPEKVREDALRYLENCYNGETVLNTDSLRTDLEAKVRKYVDAQLGYGVPDDELENNIRELLDACINTYRQALSIPMLPKILKTVSSLEKYAAPGGFAAFGFGFLLIVFLFFLQRKRQNTLYYASIATLTNALLLMGAVCLTRHYELIARLPIEESALRTLLISFLQIILDSLWKIGLIFLVSTLALLFLYLLCILIGKLIAFKKAKTAN